MSQRRAANSSKPSPAVVLTEETNKTTVVVKKGSLSLETPSPSNEEKVPLSTGNSLDGCDHGGPSPRIKHWRESPFAVGLTEPTWEAERLSMSNNGSNNKRNNKGNDEDDDDGPIMFVDDDDDYSMPRDTTGCLCCSALVCPYLGAGRVGNMVVLHATTEWIEQVEQDEETGEEKVTRYTRPRLNWVVGPL